MYVIENEVFVFLIENGRRKRKEKEKKRERKENKGKKNE
jgi:hypothetical protein